MRILFFFLSSSEICFHDSSKDIPILPYAHFHQCSSSLQVISDMLINNDWLFHLHQSSKLGIIVLNCYPSLSVFLNKGMAPRYTYVWHSQVVVMASSNLNCLLQVQIDHMKSLTLVRERVVIVMRVRLHLHRLKNQIIILGL